MKTVKTLSEACDHFRPWDSSRDSETVVIYNGGKARFLHWDKAKGYFAVDDNRGNIWGFAGHYIETMYNEERSRLRGVAIKDQATDELPQPGILH